MHTAHTNPKEALVLLEAQCKLVDSSQNYSVPVIYNKTEELSQAVEDLILAQKKQMGELNAELASQGKMMSIFTYVTLLFLPLSFMAEFRELVRAIEDMRRPMTRQDTIALHLYSKGLPRYTIRAVGRDGQVTPSACNYLNAGIFRYDHARGVLLLDYIDPYGYMYYAHVEWDYPEDANRLVWKKTRLPAEKARYRYQTRFEVTSTDEKTENPRLPKRKREFLVWRTALAHKTWQSQPRWDIDHDNTGTMETFEIYAGVMSIEDRSKSPAALIAVTTSLQPRLSTNVLGEDEPKSPVAQPPPSAAMTKIAARLSGMVEGIQWRRRMHELKFPITHDPASADAREYFKLELLSVRGG
ncbi:hypothetical protein BZA05DRAFT_444923 [Tricharina praecox]|uniref:uncharacterized protein n=1 Tax=Tricharina praecox TaxID=43433 RepID=UPI0022211233|nr:uncharacterized protein BZA05DRAFT_444923 [Tricharina praecox]KAI5852394.1 hypothetical protein BZA05DRAFT_444923 [Tricharina praecox]